MAESVIFAESLESAQSSGSSEASASVFGSCPERTGQSFEVLAESAVGGVLQSLGHAHCKMIETNERINRGKHEAITK